MNLEQVVVPAVLQLNLALASEGPSLREQE
jgi:hypothetical protein